MMSELKGAVVTWFVLCFVRATVLLFHASVVVFVHARACVGFIVHGVHG